jgi:pantoate--beta-alanine ligase
MTLVVHTRAELHAARTTLTAPLGMVATMGALHAGHRALLDAARSGNESVLATIFVNPLQFGPNEDLERYPRMVDADVAMCAAAGVDVVWAPSVEDVYIAGRVQVSISAGPLGNVLEGAIRPGHFDGMLTVVAKLINSVRPDRAYFGEKDYQQLTLIRRMVLDLDLGVDVQAVPTVRESDGLALSSRNRYLSPEDRRLALALSRALQAGASAAPGSVLEAARDALAGLEVDYLELRGVDLGDPPPAGRARLLVAAHIGNTRLIDNVGVVL